jgi:four helix bundle protein
MAKTASFRDLIAWQKAMNLVERCYAVSAEFPKSEQFVLGAQLRRAAISVASNIAEGQRLSAQAFRAYLRTALASEAELETQLELAKRLGFAEAKVVNGVLEQSEEVARLLRGLIAALTARNG